LLVFGHSGITLGAAALASTLGQLPPSRFSRLLPFGNFMSRLDLRLLAFAALLPDVIDKPLGYYILPGVLGNGRIFAHTLLFTLVLFVIGIILYGRRGRIWGLTLAFGSASHLVLDAMWRTPETLLWPAFGWGFPASGVTNLWRTLWEALTSHPTVYVPEIIGLTILGFIGVRLIMKKRLLHFLKRGRIMEGQS
jgi:inner membrane protein